MKLNNSLIISTTALALLATGCVKKADNVEPSGVYNAPQSTQTTYETAPVYDTQGTTGTTYTPSVSSTTYETASPIVYDTTYNTNSSSSSSVYSTTPVDNTVITTTGYTETTPTDYNTPYSNGAYRATNNSTTYSNPYASQQTTPNSSSSYGSYGSTASTAPAGKISLQIAALKDYYAAKEFKNTLSLDPKYSVHIQRGAMNKVIISGISTVSEANRLKERRFPGAFIVKGGSSYSSSSNSNNSSVYGSYGSGYSTNNSYGSYSSSSSSNGHVGIQIGAFSSRSKAQAVANQNSGSHKAIVKRVGGLYKVIVTGFSSRSAAKRAFPNGFIASY